MMNLEKCVEEVGKLKARLESIDQLFDLVDQVFIHVWWGEGIEGKRAIEKFRKAHLEYRKLVVQLGKDVEKGEADAKE